MTNSSSSLTNKDTSMPGPVENAGESVTYTATLNDEVIGLGGGGAGDEDSVAASKQDSIASANFSGLSAAPSGASMHELFTQSVISSQQQHDLLISRLSGLCRRSDQQRMFCDQELVYQQRLASNNAGPTAGQSGATDLVQIRLRHSLQPPESLDPIGVLRYLGAVESDKMISRRSCLDIPVAGPVGAFLRDLGFDLGFSFVAQGNLFVRGRVKILVYTVNSIASFHRPSSTTAGTSSTTSGSQQRQSGGGSGSSQVANFDPVLLQDIPVAKEWRRFCPSSWMVEVSAVGSPADESLHDEVVELVDLLYPLVTLTTSTHPMTMDHQSSLAPR